MNSLAVAVLFLVALVSPPVCGFSISSWGGDRLVVGAGAILDVSSHLSGLTTNGTVYFRFSYGETINGTERTLDFNSSTSLTDSAKRQSIVFLTAGLKQLSLHSSDSPITSLTSFTDPAIAMVRIFPSTECHSFAVTRSGSRLSLQISPGVENSAFRTAAETTTTFYQIGLAPSLSISNQTHTAALNISWNDQSSSWISDVPSRWFNSDLPLTATSRSNLKTINGCAVSTTTVDISLGSLDIPAMAASAFDYSPFIVKQDACNPADRVVFSRRNSSSIIGLSSPVGIVYRDTVRLENGSYRSFCLDAAANCASISILDIFFISKSRFLIQTDQMLLLATADSINKYDIAGLPFSNFSKISTHRSCFESRESYIYVHSNTGAVWKVNFDTSATSISVTMPSNYSLIDASRYSAWNADMFMVGTAVQGCCNMEWGCCYNQTYMLTKAPGNDDIVYEFVKSEVFSGFLVHANDLDIYAYGRTICKALSPHRFRKLLQLGNSADIITSDLHSAFGSPIVFISLIGNTYVTTLGSQHVGILNGLDISTSSFLSLDNVGEIRILEFDSSQLQSRAIPYTSSLSAATYDIAQSLIPVSVGHGAMKLYFETPITKLGRSLSRLFIRHSKGGMLAIIDVDSDGSYMNAYSSLSLRDFTANITIATGLAIDLTPASSWMKNPTTNASPLIDITILNTTSASWTSAHVGLTLHVVSPSITGSLHLKALTSSTIMSAVLMKDFVSTGTYQTVGSSEWYFIDFQAGNWNFEFDNCSFVEFDDSYPGLTVFYLPHKQNITLQAGHKLPPFEDPFKSFESKFGQIEPLISNHSSINIKVSTGDNSTYEQVSVLLEPNSFSAFTPFEFRRSYASPHCRGSRLGYRIISNCSTFETYGQQLTLNFQEFVNGDATKYLLQPGVKLLETLPANYRPPSELGDAIPLTDNIYNADPSKSRWNDIQPVSKQSGSFKSCLSKSGRSECKCTDEQRYSSLPADTDCNERVERVFFNKRYRPRVTITKSGEQVGYLDGLYSVREINSRKDWCISGMENCGVGAVDVTDATLNTELGGEVVWMGGQLYHFELTRLNASNCPVKVYAKVYVIKTPLRDAHYISVMSTVSVAFAVAFGSIYHWNSISET